MVARDELGEQASMSFGKTGQAYKLKDAMMIIMIVIIITLFVEWMAALC